MTLTTYPISSLDMLKSLVVRPGAAIGAGLLALTMCSLEAEESRVESSREVFREVSAVQPAAQPDRVEQGKNSEGLLRIGEESVGERDGLVTVQVPVRNVSDHEVRFHVRTAFFRTDGSVVPNPYPRQTGALEGLTRGFVGLISLGASELSRQEVEKSTTLLTQHDLAPGEGLTVEHQLPFRDATVVGSRTLVEALPETLETGPQLEVRRDDEEEFWRRRNEYFQARREEMGRWQKERERLDAERARESPLTESYRAAVDAYWEAHRAHRERMEAIDEGFRRFEEERKAELTSRDQARPVSEEVRR